LVEQPLWGQQYLGKNLLTVRGRRSSGEEAEQREKIKSKTLPPPNRSAIGAKFFYQDHKTRKKEKIHEYKIPSPKKMSVKKWGARYP